MAEKVFIDIELFRNKNMEELTLALSEPEGKLETGSAAAVTAAVSAALLLRAAKLTAAADDGEQARYIVKNAEILRKYMVHLIDEDVKCRGPLHKAILDNKPEVIEAARQPACAICSEIVGMMGKTLDFLSQLKDICPREALHYLGESAEMALSAVRAARLYIIDMADKCSDETYRFVSRRENDILLEQYAPVAQGILNTVEARV